MKNYIQPGNVVPVTAPAGGAVSGAGILIGALFGVAASSADAGLPVELATVGVFDLAKASGVSFALGGAVYWDATNKVCTSTSAGNTRIGVALLAADNAAAIVRTRLNGVTG